MLKTVGPTHSGQRERDDRKGIFKEYVQVQLPYINKRQYQKSRQFKSPNKIISLYFYN